MTTAPPPTSTGSTKLDAAVQNARANAPDKLSGFALYSRFALAGAVCCSVTHGGLTPVDVYVAIESVCRLLLTSNHQCQDSDTAGPCYLQQGLDWGLPPGYCQRRTWRRLDWIRSHCCRLLPPRSIQIWRLRTVQATMDQLSWLRNRVKQPHGRLPRVVSLRGIFR